MEFHDFYIMWQFITKFTMAFHRSIMYHTTKFHTYAQKVFWNISFPLGSVIKILYLFLMPLACYVLQNTHYVIQYAASCYSKLHKSKYFTQLPTHKPTLFAVIFLVRYCVFWPYKNVSKYSRCISISKFSNSSEDEKVVWINHSQYYPKIVFCQFLDQTVCTT